MRLGPKEQELKGSFRDVLLNFITTPEAIKMVIEVDTTKEGLLLKDLSKRVSREYQVEQDDAATIDEEQSDENQVPEPTPNGPKPIGEHPRLSEMVDLWDQHRAGAEKGSNITKEDCFPDDALEPDLAESDADGLQF